MFTQTLKTCVCTLLAASSMMHAESTAHTFLDGSTLQYTQLTESSKQVNQAVIDLPFMGPLKLVGTAELLKNGSEKDYTVTINPLIDPSAFFEHNGFFGSWFNIKTLPKGSFSVQLSDAGEIVKASQFVVESSNSQAIIGEFQATHEFTPLPNSKGLFLNKFHKTVKNVETKHFLEQYDPHVLRVGLKNVYGNLEEVITDISFISSATPQEYEKDLVGSISVKGKKGFTLNANVKAENPYASTPGGEHMEGFTFTLSAPVIDLSIPTPEEKKDLKEALQTNIAVYESVLEKAQTQMTAAIATSLRKHKDEIVNRAMKHFEGLTKEEAQSLNLSIKHAHTPVPNPTDDNSTLGELNFAMKDFVLNIELNQLQNQPAKLIVTMPKPETAVKKLMGDIRVLAWIYEPVLQDLGYYETIQNVTDPQKLLMLLRQLSDDPAALGDAPYKMTVQIDDNGIKIGTLTQEKATQVVLGWVLMTLPTQGNP